MSHKRSHKPVVCSINRPPGVRPDPSVYVSLPWAKHIRKHSHQQDGFVHRDDAEQRVGHGCTMFTTASREKLFEAADEKLAVPPTSS